MGTHWLRLGEGVVEVQGDAEVVDLLVGPLGSALAGRPSFFLVSVERVGRGGEILVRIDGRQGHVPVLLPGTPFEPVAAARALRTAVDFAHL